jgi:hypothetical protein
MKIKATLAVLAFCCLAVGFSFASNVHMGTWKLDEAHSKFAPGSPKNHTVSYEAAGDKIKVTVDGVDGDGKPTHNEWTGKFDGKEYPLVGDPTADSRSYKVVDARTLDLVNKKGGKVTTSGRIVVSVDGKKRIITTTGMDAKGMKVKNIAAYDKQ